MTFSIDAPRNNLLRALDPNDLAAIRPHLKPLLLQPGDVLAVAGGTIEHAYFLDGVIISFFNLQSSGERIEIGLLGCEGMTGWPVLLGSRRSPYNAVVQVGSGHALGIAADELHSLCARRSGLMTALLRFAHSFSVQVAHTAVSNLCDRTETRLARWLLMCHDRIDGDEIWLTHKYIAEVLAVRRASVTDCLHILEGRRAIDSRRGRIVIRDRDVLEDIAGEAYGLAEAHYRELIGPFGKGPRLIAIQE